MSDASKIEPLVHRCTIRSGSLAGNKHEHVVNSSDILYGGCPECGEVYAEHGTIIAHIYGQLTGL